jgi:hypothetical protein
MNITIKDGAISINLHDLIEAASREDRMAIIQTLARQGDIITEVANQIIDGYTSEGWHGARGYGGDADATYGIDGARMRIAKASSEIAASEIEALKKKIDSERQSAQNAWAAYHRRSEGYA